MTQKTELQTARFCVYSGGQPTNRIAPVDLLHMQGHSNRFFPLRASQETTGTQTKQVVLTQFDVLGSQNASLASAQLDQKLKAAPRKVVQEFDYVVVIDFEATCDHNMDNVTPQEIIEFPSVLVNCRRLALEDCFQTYVKPTYHPTLTAFCTQLTGIQQQQVDGGVALVEALDMHDRWLEEKGIKGKKFAVLIWTDWDCKFMLESECRNKGLKKPPYFNRWVNLKELYRNAFGHKCNLRTSVELAGLKWMGRPHCGLDDAINTARLALELMRQGTVLTVTCKFNIYAEDGSPIFEEKIREPQQPRTGLITSGGNLVQSSSQIGSSIQVKIDSILCFCGVQSRKRMVQKPGPTFGKSFFGCGKWTMTDGNKCVFFEWAS